jgi:vancomycin resistance protein VanJ
VEEYEAMVAGPVTGAEGDEQMSRDTSDDLRAWPEFAIPAQRADESSAEQGGAAATPSIPAQPAGETRRQIESASQVPAEFAAVPMAPPILEPSAPESADFEPAPEPEKPRKLRSTRSHRSRMRRQTSNGVIVLACMAVIFLVLHRFLPDAGGIGSLLETWLPWVGVPILLLFIIAAIVHTKRAVVVTLAAALVWTALYGPTMLPRGSSAPAQLRVFSEDVNGNAKETTASGAMALAQKADVVALEDMYSTVYESNAVNALNSAYDYHATEYEFGLWSKYPITNAQPIALGTTQVAPSLSSSTSCTCRSRCSATRASPRSVTVR